MRRLCAAVVAATAVFAFTAVPAQAQPDGLGDIPELGFEISPHEGNVGDTVDGWVDTDDVAEHCITDPFEFVEQFVDPEGELDDTAYMAAVNQILQEYFPGDLLEPPFTAEEFTYAVMGFFPLGLMLDLIGGDGELAEDAMLATMVMAFADIDTAQPHSPRGSFDPFTGEGSTPVPELEAGLYPVIATCVELNPDLLNYDDMVSAMQTTAVWVEENVAEPYPDNPLGPEFAEVAAEVAPVLLEELVEPAALGIQFYCILDQDGLCATPPDDPELSPDEEVVPAEDLVEAEAELEAEVVTAAPAFTG